MNQKVAVGSTNPVKIEAVKIGFSKVWPNLTWAVSGLAVDSQISHQPMSDLESIRGARNRATAALANSTAAYGVGLEGGVQQIDDYWFDCGWIVIKDRQGLEGIGSTARIITPQKMIDKLHEGLELGQVVDHFFGTTNAKQGQGHFGLMTNNAITRTRGYADGVIMALSRFLHPELFG